MSRDLLEESRAVKAFLALALATLAACESSNSSPDGPPGGSIDAGVDVDAAGPTVEYVTLTAMANRLLVSSDKNAAGALVADRLGVGDWEQFEILDNADGTLSLRARSNGMFIAPGADDRLVAQSATIGTAEEFTRVDQPDGTFALQAVANGQFVSTDLNLGAALYANRPAVGGAWETFSLTRRLPPSPASPDLGPDVLVFDPSVPVATIQARLDALFAKQESNQFGGERYAVLFAPGSYAVDANVGFYTQVAGLGASPDDVTITGAVHAEADWFQGNATQNFWREAENLAVVPNGGTDRWAVSQAAPYRRMHVKGSLALDDNGWSSGGFLADSLIDGNVASGSQQQWFSRSSQWGSWTGSNWNMVFAGVIGAPGGTWPNPPYTVVDKVPVVREKPFLTIDGQGDYQVFVPALRKDRQGTSWANGPAAGTSISIAQFYVARPYDDTAATINAELASGKHLLLTPGVYHLDDTIRVTRPDTVVLGLGLATLVPDTGAAAMSVADVDGVTIAGLLFDAGAVSSPVLLEVGPAGASASHAANPTALHDLFFRVGGAAVGKAGTSLAINSKNVIGDHFWIWRGDHSYGVGWTMNTSTSGLIVNGDDVTVYGLFVEHHQQYQTVWNGNGGRVYFYQSEIPYDVPSQGAWMNGPVNGYASYKVGSAVTSHEAWGLGIYCFFNDNPSVKLESAIEAPSRPGVKFHDMVTVSLGGKGEITHVVNATGSAANGGTGIAHVAQFP
ncbi:MAG: coagulation factor 5/8 type domain-containing protein [Deltaproteobacteria bacterium]|nr:coagulation factor 5/8 type domain-containing protein [Deltaproteobacteria bacterium]